LCSLRALLRLVDGLLRRLLYLLSGLLGLV